MKPIIAVVGRPNVGKSTLFNRLTRTKDAIVDDMPGVTRDRNYGNVRWEGREFTLVDTGGFVGNDEDHFAGPIRFQISQAIDDADAVVLVLDGKHGLTPFDSDLAALVRGVKKPVYYVINKIDGPEQESRLYDFYALGVDKLLPISAEHGYGVRDFLDEIVNDRIWPETETEPHPDTVRIAVVGRPNVGKSSLINRLLGEERLLVSDIPGTTRDAVDTEFEVNGKSYVLIDTAGIRRKGRVSQKIEKFSIIKALKSLDRCDVAMIVIDAGEGITDQDITVAGYAFEKGCGCVFLLNKWDLVEKDRNTAKQYIERLRDAAKFLAFAPVLTLSALTGLRVMKLFTAVDEVYAQYATRTGTGKVNRIIENAIYKNEPPLHKGKRVKFYYATQITTKPPSFVCFVNLPDDIHFSYKRYIINQIREETGLTKTPIRLFFRQRSGRKTG